MWSFALDLLSAVLDAVAILPGRRGGARRAGRKPSITAIAGATVSSGAAIAVAIWLWLRAGAG